MLNFKSGDNFLYSNGTGCYQLILFYIPFEKKLTIKERDELAKENGKPHRFGSY